MGRGMGFQLVEKTESDWAACPPRIGTLNTDKFCTISRPDGVSLVGFKKPVPRTRKQFINLKFPDRNMEHKNLIPSYLLQSVNS